MKKILKYSIKCIIICLINKILKMKILSKKKSWIDLINCYRNKLNEFISDNYYSK